MPEYPLKNKGDKTLHPSMNKDYTENYNEQYVTLPCNKQVKRESEVTGIAITIESNINKQNNKRLIYICPVCKMQHTSLLEG